MGSSSTPTVTQLLSRLGGDDALTTVTKPASTAATNTSPYGTAGAAQMDALILAVRTLITACAAKGIINEA
jgi:hypothetical protein